MKTVKKICAVSAAAVMLFGCTAQKNSNNSSTPTVSYKSTLTSADPYTPETAPLPVLSIQTKSTDPNVMDFVNEPIAEHVSELMKLWTPPPFDPPAPYYEDCNLTLKGSDGSELMAGAEGQVKVRGNWTTLYPKKPLKIKFTEKQNLLGLNDGAEFKNWLLLAEFKDGSMLRNKAALYASRQLLGADGLYAADAKLVQVEINGEYQGLYLLTEAQQVSEQRVNVTKPEKDYTGTDIGYFLEFDGYFHNEDELHGFHLDYADNAPLKPFDGKGGSGKTIKCLANAKINPDMEVGITIKSDIYSQEQHDFIEKYINNVYRIMYEAAYNHKAFVFDENNDNISESSELTPQQAVEKVVDVNSLVDMYIISELACDADVAWSSFYMDIDFSPEHTKKLTFEAPWDFDSSMGNRPYCDNGQGFHAANIIPDPSMGMDSINPWFTLLVYEDWYQDMIKEKWTKAYDNGVFSRVCQMVDSDSEVLSAEFEKNYKKWNNIIDNDYIVDELSTGARKCKNAKECADYLSDWLNKRIAFLNSQWHK